MKLSIEQQAKRIIQIMNNENMVKCPHCGAVYLPLRDEFEEICADCKMYLYETYEESESLDDEFLTEDELLSIIKR